MFGVADIVKYIGTRTGTKVHIILVIRCRCVALRTKTTTDRPRLNQVELPVKDEFRYERIIIA